MELNFATKHLAARLFMSVLFIVSGIGKLGSVEDTQQYMEAYRVPGYLLWPAAALEIGGGTMLMVGTRLGLVASILSMWCLLTASIFHVNFQDQLQKIMLMKNLAMAGGFLLIAEDAMGELSGSRVWKFCWYHRTRFVPGVSKNERDEDILDEKTSLVQHSQV